MRKTKATIFIRPDFNKKTGEYKYNKKNMDWDKITALRDKVDGMFPGLSFKKKNVKQFHHASCDYSPYQKMMDYHNNKAEEKKKYQELLEKKRAKKAAEKKKDKKAKLKKQRERAKKQKAEAGDKKEEL